MPQGVRQERNPDMVRILTADFPTLATYYLDPVRLWSAVRCAQAVGGSPLMYGFMADCWHIEARSGQQALSQIAMGYTDHGVTQYGGPYIDLNGAEALYDLDSGFQEVGGNNFFVWHWVNAASLAATIVASSKYDTNGNNCSWYLGYNSVAGDFEFVVNNTGNPANDVSVTVTYTEVIDTWYFIAGFYDPGSLTRVFVGSVTDNELTTNDNVAGIPGNLFNGTAPLGIGTAFNNAPTQLYGWNGYVGIGGARFTVPAAYVNSYALKLYGLTREFYQ